MVEMLRSLQPLFLCLPYALVRRASRVAPRNVMQSAPEEKSRRPLGAPKALCSFLKRTFCSLQCEVQLARQVHRAVGKESGESLAQRMCCGTDMSLGFETEGVSVRFCENDSTES